MRKKISILLTCILLIMLFTVNVFAINIQPTKNGGMIDVDEYIAEQENIVRILDSEAILQDPPSNAQDAHGGKFWVEWGLDRFTSCYYHETEIHRANAKNSNNIVVYGVWADSYLTCRTTIKRSLTGNKAYYELQGVD